MISVICSFVIDISGIIQSIEWYLGKWLNRSNVQIPPPFSCSLCMSWWCSLIYLLSISQFSLINLTIVCVVVSFQEQITNSILIIKEIIDWVQVQIQTKIRN